jgi:plastin-1
VLNILDEKIVDWKKACMKPENKFKKVQNTNLAIECGKALKFSLVGIGGPDITDGKKKLVLAFVWQLMRKNVLDLLGSVTEDQLLEWANERVTKVPKISSFKDQSLKSGLFLIHLLGSLDKDVVDWSLLTDGKTDEEIQKNAGYAISCARKLGVPAFIVWEDVRDVRQKMIMVFVAALAEHYKVFERKRSKTYQK